MEPFKVMPYVNISLVLYQEMALYLGLYFLLLFFSFSSSTFDCIDMYKFSLRTSDG